MSLPCSVCQRALRAPDRLGAPLQDGPVRALADTRSFTVCEDHTAQPHLLRGAVLAAVDARLPSAVRRRRTTTCTSCAEVLDLPLRATTRALTIEPTDGPPFTLTLALPLVRCGGCGLDNVPHELTGVVRRCALAAAGASERDTLRDLGSRLLRGRRRHAGPGSRARP